MLRLNTLLTLYVLLALLHTAAVSGLPIVEQDLDPELTAGQFEGDMILTEDQLREIRDAIHRQAILDGIATLEARTCIRFKEADDSQAHYVAITSDSGGCYTAVGYQAKVQQMNLQVFPLNEGCFRIGTILHEFMHALGFYHQQSDPNRDNYIEVLYDNIIPGKEFNFEKYKSSFVTDFDVGYDYQSCLHYRAAAFSVNGEPTIRTLDPNVEIGQREELSKKDIDKINVMYKCPILI
ncbi:hypothetical protein DOY81_008664 [Sarcophaga bullata]|nr:hypothetical protein DOY81_008664 [Sarcophaga bullata]